MAYDSIDALQKALARIVFHYARDPKKAAGRSLGTLVEIITFYLLKSWGLERYTAIERGLPEYANPEITHNVEFTLHPSFELASLRIPCDEVPLTTKKLALKVQARDWTAPSKAQQLLSRKLLLRNACVIHEDAARLMVAYLGKPTETDYSVFVHQLVSHPFAVVECKRVGVEEAPRRGHRPSRRPSKAHMWHGPSPAFRGSECPMGAFTVCST